jgi:ferric-dicitrate binding protein FerR (iron transport regulator)
MPKINDTVLIANYLVKYLQDKCDSEEKAIVEEWLANPKNKAIFENIKKKNSKVAYDKYSIDLSDIRKSFYSNFENKKRTGTNNILSYAAVAILLIGLTFVFFIIDLNKDYDANTAQNSKKIELRYEAPILMTSKGEKFVISHNNLHKTIQENNGVMVNIKGDSLKYEINENTTEEIAYNTIKVPDCGNFNFTMSDGTIVFLNAGTTLKYPIPFHKNKREIYLEGEAYFEVTKNKEKPFVVKFNKGTVKVLGTKFNVKSYIDKPVTTTLVSGSVLVKDANKNSVVLKPNEQAVFVENTINVSEVDPYWDIIWKDGYFVYKMIRLDDILQELSKWYGFEYFYQNQNASDILFSARIKKFDSINEVLKILENTGDIKFRIKNNTVIVTR